MKQRIICAAIKHKLVKIIIIGPRHYDKLMSSQIKVSDYIGWANADQGFIDQHGTFLTREEAYIVANENNQIIRRVGGDEGKLFSENLY